MFNVFCKLSEALDIAHNSVEVSTFQKLDIQDSISKLNSEILNNATENLKINQLEEYFLYDREDHKSLLIEHISETCYTGFRYWESLLEHSATDHFLNRVTPTRKFVENSFTKILLSFFIKLLLFVTSPICGLPLGDKFERFVTVYPDFYFISCGHSFYMIVGMLLFDYLETDSLTKIWILVSIWLFLLYLWILKVEEEARHYIEIGSRISTSLNFIDKINVYFYDFWNYLDIALIVSFLCFLITALITIITREDEDNKTLTDIHRSVAVLAMVMCSVNFAKISKYGAKGVPVIDATVVMMKAFFQYLLAITPVLGGMILSTLLVSDHDKKFESFQKMAFGSLKSMAGLQNKDEVLIDEGIAKKVYWGLWYLITIIVLLRGLVAMMTALLRATCSNRQVSKEFRRRLVNLDRIKLLDQMPDSFDVKVRRASLTTTVPMSLSRNFSEISRTLIESKIHTRHSAASLYYAQTVASVLLTSSKFKLNVNEKAENGQETITSLLSKMQYLIQSSTVLKDQFDEYLESHPRAKKQAQKINNKGEESDHNEVQNDEAVD